VAGARDCRIRTKRDRPLVRAARSAVSSTDHFTLRATIARGALGDLRETVKRRERSVAVHRVERWRCRFTLSRYGIYKVAVQFKGRAGSGWLDDVWSTNVIARDC
jgi:hypothetical protein